MGLHSVGVENLFPPIMTRAQAGAAGLKKYFTGKSCPRGHVDYRQYPQGICLECKREGARDWKSRNAERNSKWQKEWRRKNPDLAHALRSNWQKRNRTYLNAWAKEWFDRNPGKRVQYHSARRTRVLKAEGSFTADDARAIRKAQRDRCAYCRTKLYGRGHLDHIIALSKGGTNWPRNLQWLCETCNVRKSAIDPVEFARREGRLL